MRRVHVALAFLGVSTILTLVFVAQSYGFRTNQRGPWSLSSSLLYELSYWYLWGAFLPLILLASRYVPLMSGRRLGILPSLLMHVLIGTLLVLLHQVAYFVVRCPIDRVLGQSCQIQKPLLASLGRAMTTFGLALYWLMLFAAQMRTYYRGWRDENLKVAQLTGRLAQAELSTLKMQLQPHFLFNTLHAISTLMYRDVEAANAMLVRLSDLLRRSLRGHGRQEVPLGEELGFSDDYLQIEKTRFGERLQVSVAVPSELLDVPVPNLLLQPLLENAIRHGIGPRAAPGHIELRASSHGDMLRIEVLDDGLGLGGRPPREGIGLGNTRARLVQLHGNRQRLTLAERPGGGVHVTVELPIPESKESRC